MTSISRTLARLGTLGTFSLLNIAQAFAADANGNGVPDELEPSAPVGAVGANSAIDIKDIIAFAATYLLSIAGGLAVLFLVVGGIIYTTAGGSDEKVAKAKKYMMNAIVGLVVVLLAFVIVGNTLKVTYRLDSNATPNASTPLITGTTLNCVTTCPATLGVSTPTGTTLTAVSATTRTIVLPAGIPAGTAVTVTVMNGATVYATGSVTK